MMPRVGLKPKPRNRTDYDLSQLEGMFMSRNSQTARWSSVSLQMQELQATPPLSGKSFFTGSEKPVLLQVVSEGDGSEQKSFFGLAEATDVALKLCVIARLANNNTACGH